MGPSGRITHVIGYIGYIEYIGLLGTGFMQVFFLGRAPRTKETARFSEVASGNPISTCIPRVDGKSTDPRDWGVTVSTAPSGPYSFMYPFLRFIQT